jgi:cell division protein FtsW (lipid II flippase)
MVETLSENYQNNFLTYEFIISLLVSALAIYLIQYYWSAKEIQDWMFYNKSMFYTLLATISGTLLGFIVTGISVIMSLSESPKLETAKKSTQFKKIFVVYFNTIKYLAFTVILSIIGFLVNNDSINTYLLYALIILVVISAFRVYRSIWVLKNIVDIIIPDVTKSSNI